MREERTPFKAQDVGFDPSRLVAVDAHLRRLIDGGQLQSANYCLSRDGKVFAARAHGKLSFRADDARETGPDAVQWIASITKLFTACAIFRLVEDGIIRLGQSAGSVLDELKAKPFADITIAQLLSHTSGLNPDPGCFSVAYGKNFRDYIALMPDRPWLEAGLSVGMRSKPGEEWMYNTFGYIILGELITRASGVDCHEYIRREIIDACGLPDTFFFSPAPTEDERARLSAVVDRMIVRNPEDELELGTYRARTPLKPPPAAARRQAQVPRTGGGIFSTAADLNRFGVMLMNAGALDGERVLGRRTALRMTENFTLPAIKDWCWGAGGVHRDYALGPDKRRNADSLYSPLAFFHEGNGPCALIVDPEERLVASWFVPTRDGGWNAEAVYNTGAVIWSGLK